MNVRIPYLEHCPECIEAVKCRPIWLRTTDSSGVAALYQCPICRHSWWTSWERKREDYYQ